MRKYLKAGVTSLLLLAACKSTGDNTASNTSGAAATSAPSGTSGPSSTSGTSAATTSPSGTSATSGTSTTTAGPTSTAPAAPADPRAPGVTADSIKIGVTYVDLSKLKDILKINHGDYETAYRAIFDAFNAEGGLNGRKLEPVIAAVDPIGTASGDAACTKLTQDEKVFVTIGFFNGENVLCYVDVNETPVIGGDMTAERLGKAKVPWYTLNPSDDSEVDAIRALAAAGKLAGKVAVVGMADDQKSLDTKIKPVLDELKINVVETALNDAPTNDASATYAAAQTIAEKFKSEGAEQVLVIGPGTAPGWLTGLSQTDYRPENRFSVRNSAEAYSGDKAVLEGALTAAPFDGSDVFDSLGDPTKECFDIQRAAGLTILPSSQVAEGDPDQYVSSFSACSQMYLLKAILEKAGSDLNFGTFRAAGDSLGQVVLPGSKDPWTFGAPPHADGDPKLFVYKWDAAADHFLPAE